MEGNDKLSMDQEAHRRKGGTIATRSSSLVLRAQILITKINGGSMRSARMGLKPTWKHSMSFPGPKPNLNGDTIHPLLTRGSLSCLLKFKGADYLNRRTATASLRTTPTSLLKAAPVPMTSSPKYKLAWKVTPTQSSDRLEPQTTGMGDPKKTIPTTKSKVAWVLDSGSSQSLTLKIQDPDS